MVLGVPASEGLDAIGQGRELRRRSRLRVTLERGELVRERVVGLQRLPERRLRHGQLARHGGARVGTEAPGRGR